MDAKTLWEEGTCDSGDWASNIRHLNCRLLSSHGLFLSTPTNTPTYFPLCTRVNLESSFCSLTLGLSQAVVSVAVSQSKPTRVDIYSACGLIWHILIHSRCMVRLWCAHFRMSFKEWKLTGSRSCLIMCIMLNLPITWFVLLLSRQWYWHCWIRVSKRERTWYCCDFCLLDDEIVCRQVLWRCRRLLSCRGPLCAFWLFRA